jgi:hypothetical protein
MWKARGERVVFTKWLRPDRTSPGWGSRPLVYPVGQRVEVPDAVASDQQCAAGIHVLERGHRPEWYGLCSPDETGDLIAVDFEVETDDILFGGLPGMTGKIRVRGGVALT